MQHARFVSQLKALHVTVRPHQNQKTVLNAEGTAIQVPPVPELAAQFEHGLLTYEDAAAVKAHYSKLIGTNEDEAGRPLDPTYRFSAWDSEVAQLQNGWSDEETQQVIEALRKGVGNDYFEIEKAPATKPWNNYDDMDAEQIVATALAIDADLHKIIEYEKANQFRTDVLAALAEALDAAEETVIVQA